MALAHPRPVPPVKNSLEQERHMAAATLTLSSKNYSSWSMRGWLMAKLAGIDFKEIIVEPDPGALPRL
jgi:glutathione S-transferase